MFIRERSVPEVPIHLGAMDRFVAARRPTGSLLQASGVISVADQNPAIGGSLLEMTLQTERRVTLG